MPDFNIEFDPEDVDPRSQNQEETEAEKAASDYAYEMVAEIVKSVNRYYPKGIPPNVCAIIITQFLMQMRVFFYPQELHTIMHKLLVVAEKNVTNDEWMDAETGERAHAPVLAEHVRGNPDGPEMYQALKDGVDDDALRKLLEEGE